MADHSLKANGGFWFDGSEIRKKPVDVVNIPLFTRFYTSQVVQDFFHQQYFNEKNRERQNRVTRLYRF